MFINHLNTKIKIYKHLPNDVMNYYESTTYFINVTEHLEKRNGHRKSQVSCF